MIDPRVPPGQGWMAESLHPVVISGPAHYSVTTNAPIRVFDVHDGARLLGYLWASLDDEAASFEANESVGDAAFNASVDWHVALRDPKARGLGALAALDEMLAGGGPPHAGVIDIASGREMASLADLEALAKP